MQTSLSVIRTGSAGDPRAAGADVAREGRERLVLAVERPHVGGKDERGAAERAPLAEPEGVEQRRDQLARHVAPADPRLQRVQRSVGLDQQA
jgi:hypothetical protein